MTEAADSSAQKDSRAVLALTCPLCECEESLTIGSITYPDHTLCAECRWWSDWRIWPHVASTEEMKEE